MRVDLDAKVLTSDGNDAGSVQRAVVDPQTNEVVATLTVAGAPSDGSVLADGSVWFPLRQANALVRIDPATNRVVERRRVGKGPFVVNEGFGDLWVGSYGGGDVWRLRR